LYRNGARMIQKFIPGLGADGLTVSNSFDGVQGELLTEFMPKIILPNRCGMLYANS